MNDLPSNYNHKYLTIQEAAAYLGVSKKTLRRWEKAGILTSSRTKGGHRRYYSERLIAFNRARSLPSAGKTVKEVNIPYFLKQNDILPAPGFKKIAKKVLLATAIVSTTTIFLAFLASGQINISNLIHFRTEKTSAQIADATANSKVLAASSTLQNYELKINIPTTFRKDILLEGSTVDENQTTITLTDPTADNTITFPDASGEVSLLGQTIELGTETTGSIDIATGGTGLTALGTAGQILLVNSTADALSYVTVGGDGTLSSSGSFALGSNTVDDNELVDSLTYTGTFTPSGTIDITGTFKIDGTEVTATAAQINASVHGSVTAGGVMFGDGTKVTQDATNFYWDDTNNRLGLGTSTPSTTLDVTGTATITNNTTSNVTIDLTSTGDFAVANSGTAFATFNSNSGLVFADGALLDLSSITHNDAAAQGFKLPQATSFTAISGGGEGYLAWDSSANNLVTFDGSSWSAISGGSLFTDGGTTTYLTSTTDDLALGGSDSTASFFYDVSASALSLNPYGAAAGNTGETRYVELAANGTNYTGFKSPDSLVGNVIYTLPSADATTSNQVLASSAAGVLSWIDVSAGSGALWTDGGTTTYLTSTTDDLAVGGSASTSPLFVDVSASALSLNPYDTLSGATGEIRFTELAANGTEYTGFKSPDSLVGNVVYTLPSADGGADQILSTSGGGVLSWIDVSAGSGGLWTRSSTNTYLTNTTDELIVGGTSPLSSAKVSIDGDTDQTQLLIQGNATQTSTLFRAETSAAGILFTLDNSGNTVTTGTIDVNGAGTNDIAGTLNLSGNALTSSGDLVITPAGGDVTVSGTFHSNDVVLADTYTLQVGGVTGTAYNVLANSGQTPTQGAIAADNDLLIGGDLEVLGTLYATLSGSFNPSFTTGSVIFQGASGLAQDNTNFFWDDTNNLLGIGTNSPVSKFDLSGAVVGKALASFNETGDQSVFTASASGSTVFEIGHNGATTIGTTAKDGANLTVYGDILQGKNNDLTSLANITSTFIYDTTKDSDGGRWINNAVSQNLSWYTETRDDGPNDPCNISTDDRCTQAAFPRRAILVTTSSGLYIYDAASNKLWMKFSQGTSFALGTDASNDPNSVFALDGSIYVALNGASSIGLVEIDFKKDRMFTYDSTDRSQSDVNISNRNTTNTYSTDNNTNFALIDTVANDVHATRFDGGPVIAVATDTGVSVIHKNDQRVYDYSDVAGDDYNSIWLTDTNLYALNETQAQLEQWTNVVMDKADEIAGTPDATWDETTTPALTNAAPTIPTNSNALYLQDGKIYVGTDQGLSVVTPIVQEYQAGSTNGPQEQVIDSSYVQYLTTSYESTFEMPNIKGDWPFYGTAGSSIADGTNNVDDVSVAGNDITAKNSNGTGMAYYAGGPRGTAITFDGTDDYLCSDSNDDDTCDDVASFDPGATDNFTVGVWFKTSTDYTGGKGVLISKRNAAGGVGWELGVDTSNFPYCEADDGNDDTITGTVAVNDGRWHHLMYSRRDNTYVDGNETNCYLDGVSIGESANIDGSLDNTLALMIGALNSGSPSNFFTGQIASPFFSTDAVEEYGLIRSYYQNEKAGTRVPITEGTATSGTSTTISDSGQSWVSNDYVGLIIEITGGTGSGQTRKVIANTSTQITVNASWTTTPDATSTYSVKPFHLIGATNSVTAITGSDNTVYIGTNDGSDGGAVSQLSVATGQTLDTFHGLAGKSDDAGTAWDTTTDYDDITALAADSKTLAIGSLGLYWHDQPEYSLIYSPTSTAQSSTPQVRSLTKQPIRNQVIITGREPIATTSYPGASVFKSNDVIPFYFTFDTPPVVITGDIQGSWNPNQCPPADSQIMDITNISFTLTRSTTVNCAAASWAAFTVNWLAIGTYSDYSGNGADLAENYYTSDKSLESGDVISIDTQKDISVARSTGAYDSKAIGIVATQPSITIGPKDGTTPGVATSITGNEVAKGEGKVVPVALAGRVPVKISLENGPIKRGDYLAPASTPGYAMKAVKPGLAIGKALEDYDGEHTIINDDKSLAQIDELIESGDIAVSSEGTNIDALTEKAKEFLDPKNHTPKIMAFVSLGYYLGDLTSDGGLTIDPTTAIKKIEVADNANLLKKINQKPSQDSSVSAQAEANPDPNKEDIENTQDGITVTEAIGKLLSRIESVESDLDILKNQPLSSPNATESGNLSGLSVTGNTVLGDLVVSGKADFGTLNIDGLNNSINTVGTLRLQPLGFGDIEILGGKVTIDKDGNVKVNKVEVAGASAGQGKVIAGKDHTDIETQEVTDGSLIFVTPTSKTSFPLVVSEKKAGEGFTVSLPTEASQDIGFDWWIVDKKLEAN